MPQFSSATIHRVTFWDKQPAGLSSHIEPVLPQKLHDFIMGLEGIVRYTDLIDGATRTTVDLTDEQFRAFNAECEK